MDKKKLTILFGSQNGTAQDIAERLWRESRSYGFHGPVLPMDEYNIPSLQCERLLVFVCSTTGQGEEPDNMKKFWRFLLKKNLPSNLLANIKFGVLGLGDSSYVKFNFAAKKLYRRLLQLGASPLTEPGYADDQHELGIDAIVDPWIEKFWSTLFSSLQLSHETTNRDNTSFQVRWIIEKLNTIVNLSIHRQLPHDFVLKENATLISCISNDRVTASDHFQDTRLIKLEQKNLNYEPGDVLMVRPKNSNSSVQKFFELFINRKDEINDEVVIRVTQKFDDMPVPHSLKNPLYLKTIVQEYWDLNFVPRRYTFKVLSAFVDNELEREKLLEFDSAAGQQELYSYCNRPKRTILEVLCDFPHTTAKIPFEYLFEIFQPIRPRAFSIASSPKAHPEEIHILVAVVKYKTIIKAPRIGLCSTWLASLLPGDQVFVHLRQGSLQFPFKEAYPTILIGPGTGIAPLRSFVCHDACSNDVHRVNHLYFGCRNKEKDFYFQDDFKELTEKQKIVLYTAFSRDQTNKVYVQHIIKKNSHLMWKLISDNNAYIFICGNSKDMPKAVRTAFVSCISDNGNMKIEDSEKFIQQLEIKGHYQTETWS